LPDIYVPPAIESIEWLPEPEARRTRLRPHAGERDSDRPLPVLAIAVARAIPALLAAGVAIAGTVGSSLMPAIDLPVVLLLVVVVQLAGYWFSRLGDLWPWGRTFLANAAIVLILLPMLAVQTSATRMPYVSNELGTLRPAVIATVAAAAALVGFAIAAVVMAWDAPEDASLLFLPAGLLVPVMLGSSFAVGEGEVTPWVAGIFLLTAGATFLALIMPIGLRALVGPVGLGVFFALLLALGRRPTREPTSDDVVRILDGCLVAAAIVLTVVVPIVALGIRRVMREVHAAERAMLIEQIGQK
jgi:hypothetical protein